MKTGDCGWPITCPGGTGGPGDTWCCCNCWFIICNLFDAVPSGAICGGGAPADVGTVTEVDVIPPLQVPGDMGTTAAAAPVGGGGGAI